MNGARGGHVRSDVGGLRQARTGTGSISGIVLVRLTIDLVAYGGAIVGVVG